MSTRSIAAVILFLGLVYVGVVFGFGYGGHVSETMLSLQDARQYQAVADWLVNEQPTRATLIRPLLYPVVLALIEPAAGIRGVWIVQALFWLAGGLLLFSALRTFTQRTGAAVVGLLLYATNLTLVLLTLHAMPETLVTFGLTAYVWVVAARRRLGTDRALLILLALSAVLAATKPSYVGLFLVIAAIEVVRLVRLSSSRATRAAWIVAACLPVLLQLGIMGIRHGVLGLSTIGGAAVRRYSGAELYRELHGGSLGEARAQVEPMSSGQLASMALDAPGTTVRVWLRLVRENISARSPVTDIPAGHPALSGLMQRINAGYLVLHLVMILPTLALLAILVRRRRVQELTRLALLAVPVVCVMATAGLTFMQGDRIVLPSLPVWISLYAVVLASWWRMFSRRGDSSR
ncbi:MAG: hypothetical protein LJE95_11905 [Acidobacteria bacterium]|nr:hypothetical protein [Acidobacteriota bacterium]